MGIKDLSKFLVKNAPGSIRRVNINEYMGKKAAIDISNFIYKALYNAEMNDRSHVTYIFKQAIMLMTAGIIPIYVFDGKPPEQKGEVLKNRRDKKKNAEEKKKNVEEKKKNLEVSENSQNEEDLDNEIRQISKSIIYVTEDHIREIKELLDIMGVKYIQSNGEAEAVCAKLYKAGKVDLCITEDFDILPFGGGIFVRKLTNNSNMVEEINLEKVLDELGLSQKQFVEFCILCGCDYTCTITQVGSVTGLKFIKKYGGIRKLIKKEITGKDVSRYSVPDEFDYRTARSLFMTPGAETNISDVNVRVGQVNFQKLYKFFDGCMDKNEIDKKMSKFRKHVPKGKAKAPASHVSSMGSIVDYFG